MTEERQLNPEALGDHIDRLYRAAWGLCGTREDAEDLVQDTFERVLKRPRLLRSTDDLGYLMGAMRNTFLDSRREAARRPRQAELIEGVQTADPSARHNPEARLRAAELYAAIAALPGDFRDALVAVDVAGLSYAEAARALRVREATLTTRLHRARQRLADALRLD